MSAITYKAIERQSASIPIDQILSQNGSPEIYPNVLSKNYFDIDFRRDSLVFKAGAYIGQIPINDRVIIDVVPKITIGNLVHIISRSENDIRYLDFFSRQYQSAGVVSNNIFEFLCNCLLIELRMLVKEGVLKQYNLHEEKTSMPRGRINLERSMALNWSKGCYQTVFVQYYQQSPYNHYNSLIKYTLWYVLNHLIKIDSSNRDLISSLSEMYQYFEFIEIDRQREFIEPVVEGLRKRKLPVIRHYYANICHVCLSIIHDIGIEIQRNGEDIELSSFIIDMAMVFERYIFNILTKSERLYSNNLSILDGNAKGGMRKLFLDNKLYTAKPDVIIKNNSDTCLLIDVKYKDSIKESDRYQIITHALCYGAKKAVLAMPTEKKIPNPCQYVGKLGEVQTVELYVYYFNLSEVDLLNEEAMFIDEMLKLCT